jgi:hypothetical protein
VQLAQLLEQRRGVVVAAVDRLPHRVELGAVLLDVAGALLGEVDDPAAVGLLDADEAFVLQLRERGVHRAGAGAPGPTRPLGDLLDDLVAVPGLLGDQREHRGADVTAGGATAPAARSAEAAGEAGRHARAEARTEGRSAAALPPAATVRPGCSSSTGPSNGGGGGGPSVAIMKSGPNGGRWPCLRQLPWRGPKRGLLAVMVCLLGGEEPIIRISSCAITIYRDTASRRCVLRHKL